MKQKQIAMTPMLAISLSKMVQVTKKEFDAFFASERFVSKSYYFQDEQNKIYCRKSKEQTEVAIHLYDTNQYFLLN